MSKDRLLSTGRKPVLAPAGVRSLLERYFGEDRPGVKTLAAELKLTEATVRKYLKAAGLILPRGRAALKPRDARNVDAVMNRIPTEMLIGKGRMALLVRRLQSEDAPSLTSLAREFGITKDRVARLRDRFAPVATAPVAEAVEASAVESTDETSAETEEATEVAEPAEQTDEQSDEGTATTDLIS